MSLDTSIQITEEEWRRYRESEQIIKALREILHVPAAITNYQLIGLIADLRVEAERHRANYVWSSDGL